MNGNVVLQLSHSSDQYMTKGELASTVFADLISPWRVKAGLIHKSVRERKKKKFPPSVSGKVGTLVTASCSHLFCFPLFFFFFFFLNMVLLCWRFVSHALIFKKCPMSVHVFEAKTPTHKSACTLAHRSSVGRFFRCFVWSEEMKAQSTK